LHSLETSQMLVPVNFWLLCSSAAPSKEDVALCRNVLDAHRSQDTAATTAALSLISRSQRPIAVEIGAAASHARSFYLPQLSDTMTLSEGTFGECGFGHQVWGAGVALAIWLSLNPAVVGRNVLELGSGVGGIGGIAAALVGGASAVTLSDIRRPALLSNLASNAASEITNGCEAKVVALDWHACLHASFAPEETYDLIIAADCVYSRSDAPALAAACLAHLAPGGLAVAMNRVGRAGEASGACEVFLDSLSALGPSAGVATQDLNLINNYGSEALQLVTIAAPRPES